MLSKSFGEDQQQYEGKPNQDGIEKPLNDILNAVGKDQQWGKEISTWISGKECQPYWNTHQASNKYHVLIDIDQR